jgi:predicted nucleic-acid-binding protein
VTPAPTPVESIDANVLIRAVLEQDTAQGGSARNLLGGTGRQFWVSALAWAELVHALDAHYSFSRRQVAELVTAVLDMGSIQTRRDILAAAVAHFLSHPKLSFEDCYMAEEARLTDAAPLWTSDKKLARQHPTAREVR